MFTSLLVLLITAGADARASDVIPVQTPYGLRLLEPRPHAATATEADLLKLYVRPRPDVTYASAPVPQTNLPAWYRVEAEAIAADAIRLAVEFLGREGVRLDAGRGAPVTYVIDPVHWPEHSTPGLITTCWTCFEGGPNRDLSRRALGLDGPPLAGGESSNPRFVGAQLVRHSASEISVALRTVERGRIDFSILVVLEESYHPFVADVPGRGRLFGSSQRLRVRGESPFPRVTSLHGTDVFSLSTVRSDDGRVPSAFREVRDASVPDESLRSIGRARWRSFTRALPALGLVDEGRVVISRGDVTEDF